MREPELGKDYLIDFYAILKVERDADAETIHGTYRKMARAYHTDQYQSLAPELKAQADQKMAVLNLAIEILLDPQKRQEYDAQLSEWKGPLSKTGVPIINLDSPFFSSVPLLIGSIEDPDLAKDQKRLAAQLTGHDQNTLALLEKLYKQSEKPSAELESAYREALRKKDLCLEIEMHILWEGMGYYNRPTDKQASEDYLEKTEKELQEARRRVIGDLGEKLALIQGGELKALGPGGEELTQALLKDPQQALAQYAEILNQRFDMGAEKIRALAQERQATISQRMGVIECKYWPEQTVFFPKIIVRIRVAENQVWLAFKLINDNTIVTDESVDTENLSLLSQSEEEAQNWLARGYNILLIEAEDNLAIKAQLHKVLSDHFQKVLVNEDAS